MKHLAIISLFLVLLCPSAVFSGGSMIATDCNFDISDPFKSSAGGNYKLTFQATDDQKKGGKLGLYSEKELDLAGHPATLSTGYDIYGWQSRGALRYRHELWLLLDD